MNLVQEPELVRILPSDRITQTEQPILVRGLSRSGGTLMVTILDAHPDVAMSYELYPSLLEFEDGGADKLLELAKRLERARNLKAALRVVEHNGFRTFVARCPRGGMDHQTLAKLLVQHVEQGLTFNSSLERLVFIGQCCRAKMERMGKRRWGLKCGGGYRDYLALWPESYILNMLRDGRDVLASQLSTGAFKNSPDKLAASWINTHVKFRQLMADPAVRAYEVRYETLVTEPETEIRCITDFLGLVYEREMLEFYRMDLTIYTASHLSMDRISVAVDTARVGCWKRDLSTGQIAEFMRIAGAALQDLGYAE